MSNDIFARMRGVSRSWGYARVLLAFPKTCGRRSGRFAVDLPVVCWETTSYLWSSRTPGSLKYIYTRRLSVIYFLCSLFLRISWFWLFKSIFYRYYYFSSWISIQKFFVGDFLEKERERESFFWVIYYLIMQVIKKQKRNLYRGYFEKYNSDYFNRYSGTESFVYISKFILYISGWYFSQNHRMKIRIRFKEGNKKRRQHWKMDRQRVERYV